MSSRPLDETTPPETGQRAWLRAATLLLAVVAAIVVVHYELGSQSYRQILRELHAISAHDRVLAVLFTIAGYAALTIYDFLALRHANAQLSFVKTAFTSFVAFAFSNTLGWPLSTVGSVR